MIPYLKISSCASDDPCSRWVAVAYFKGSQLFPRPFALPNTTGTYKIIKYNALILGNGHH